LDTGVALRTCRPNWTHAAARNNLDISEELMEFFGTNRALQAAQRELTG
jgi:hypothetical protein